LAGHDGARTPVPRPRKSGRGYGFQAQAGPVEIAVSEEIDGLASQARPGLAAAALAIARVLDNPRAVNQQPAAAKVLISMLEKLRSASPAGRRGLAVVREMTKKGGT
jgi:hypothetical protein